MVSPRLLSPVVFSLALWIAAPSYAQRCVVDVVVLNKNRKVTGDVNRECGKAHSAPFGNWGARVRRFGDHRLRDGYQFSGWKVDDGWLQWNSCTRQHRRPDRRYYNDDQYTTQTGVPNVVNAVESRRDHLRGGRSGQKCEDMSSRNIIQYGCRRGSQWKSRSWTGICAVYSG